MEPMRLQRYLARAGVASRRQAEELIKERKVKVNGHVAELGSSVTPGKDRVTVGKRVVNLAERRWIALHKPAGVVTTADDEQGRRTVFDLVPEAAGLTYVGRLDAGTTGLLLLTTDGDAVHRLTHPRWRVPRRYIALVHGVDTATLTRKMSERVMVEQRPVVPVRASPPPSSRPRRPRRPQHCRRDPHRGSQPDRAEVGRGDGRHGRTTGARRVRTGQAGRSRTG